MVLYKYLPPTRVAVLQRRTIRFTQPCDFNDPFEFRPFIGSAASDGHVKEHIEANFARQFEEEVTRHPELRRLAPAAVIAEVMESLKAQAPGLVRLAEPHLLAKVSPLIDEAFNRSDGVLCFSEVRDSTLRWAHYTESHRGFVVGFDADHSFFSKRRTDRDEFRFLRQVEYTRQRPNVVLSESTSHEWFQTKCSDWAYEREWRIVRVLSEADRRIDGERFPVCLFCFPPDAVVEIIVGLRSPESLAQEIRSFVPGFPRAKLLKAREDPTNYGLIIDEVDRR